jgi:hypothetical protein
MLDAVIAFVWPEGMAYHTFIGEGRRIRRCRGATSCSRRRTDT